MSAAESLDMRLQVGRVLRGRLLAVAVLLRELPLLLVGESGSRGAPTWVVVSDRETRTDILRVRTGREIGAGELLLAAMSKEAREMDREAFLARWQYRR